MKSWNTVLVDIERHSQLERHGTHFMYTMVIFGRFFIQNYYILGQKIAKKDHYEQPKIAQNK